jgi:hypothetical protein
MTEPAKSAPTPMETTAEELAEIARLTPFAELYAKEGRAKLILQEEVTRLTAALTEANYQIMEYQGIIMEYQGIIEASPAVQRPRLRRTGPADRPKEEYDDLGGDEMIYVYRLPEKMSDGYCFGKVVPITFTNVDWFDGEGYPAGPTRSDLEAFIKSKRYYDPNRRFLVIGAVPKHVFAIEP